jgi:uncharacterized membrane protein YhfC
VPTIVPMAIITLVVSAALWGWLLYAYSGRSVRFLTLVPLGLPLSAVVNLAVKAPLAAAVGAAAGIESGLGLQTPAWFLIFLFLLSPVFEELVKVVPVVLPLVRRRMGSPDDAFLTGLALGIGFGLGEAAYLGWQIGASGAYEMYPWYAFTGFFGERVMVVFLHGFMTAVFLWLVARKRPTTGFFAAAGTHAVLNAGAMLYQLGLAPEWAAGLSLVVTLVACVIVFERIRPRAPRAGGADEVVYYHVGE